MKSELVITDLSGHHNDNIGDTVERLRRGGTWKQQRIVVIVPAADVIPSKVVLSWWNLAFPPNNGAVKMIALGDEVGVAYSSAIESIINHPQLKDWEYIVTIEHDNAPPADGIVRLAEQMVKHPEFACIGGLYFTKGYGGCAQIWGDVKDPIPNFRPQLPDPNGGLVECCGTGMGFNIWRISMFKDSRLKRPWFRTKNGTNNEGIGTQDLVFWEDARKHGYRCAIDCSIKVGHYDLKGEFGPPDFMW